MSSIDLSSLDTSFITSITMGKVVSILCVLLACLALQKLAIKLLRKTLAISKIETRLHTFIVSIAKIGIYILIVLIIADMLGIPVASLIAVLSVAGLAISLSVQGVLSNIAGGINILLTKPFVIGDYINANGIEGTIKEIGLSHTIIGTTDNKIIFVPNSTLSNDKIINFTTSGTRRLEIIVGACYNSPIANVKKALAAVVARHPEILDDPAVFINVIAYGDNSIDYVVRAWVATTDYWPVYFAMLEEISEEFEKHGVSMSYPHVNVHMIEK